MFVVTVFRDDYREVILAFSLRDDAVKFCQDMTGDVGQDDYFYNEEGSFAYQIDNINIFRHSHRPRDEIHRIFSADPNLHPGEVEVLTNLSMIEEEAPEYVDPNFETPPPTYRRSPNERSEPAAPRVRRVGARRNLFN